MNTDHVTVLKINALQSDWCFQRSSDFHDISIRKNCTLCMWVPWPRVREYILSWR